MLESALRYASMGWAVLPLHSLRAGACTCGRADCKSPGKHPHNDLVPHGVHDASTDAHKVSEWFTRVPHANVGIATGAPSGFDALDVDPRNGGDDTLADIERQHGKLPDTALALTGGGGYHYLFKHDGSRLRSPGRGIDVKSTGGYIVVEPSSHVSGGTYAWEGSADPTEGHTIAPSPAWLAAPASARAPTIAAAGYLDAQRVADLQAALKHLDATDYAQWIAVGQALHSTESPEAFDLWDAWSQTAANYDGSTAAKWRTFRANGPLHVESIFVWARDAGWDGHAPRVAVPAAEVQPFTLPDGTVPAHLLQLPGALGIFADLHNRTAPYPQPLFGVQAALAFGATVLGRRYKTTRDNWPSLYLVNIGKSSSGKNHARTVLDTVLDAAGLGQLYGPPAYSSASAITSALLSKPCHLSIIDEFGDMLSCAAQRGNFHRAETLTLMKDLWGNLGGTHRQMQYSTMGASAQQATELSNRFVRNPALTLLGLATPKQFYGALTEAAIEGGFLNRLIVAQSTLERSLSREAEPLEVPGSLIQWCQAAREGANTGNLSGVDLAADLAPVPRVVDFDGDALALLRDYEAEILAEQNTLDAEGLDELQGRSREKAMRIALILAVSDDVSRPRIRAEHARWAIDYVRWTTAQTIDAVRQHMHGTVFGEWRSAVLGVIRKGGEKGRTERELAQHCRTFAGMDPRQRKSVLDALKSDGLVEFVESRSASGRGRPRQAWVACQTEYSDVPE